MSSPGPTRRRPCRALAPGLTPEMVAAVSKIMRNQDLIAVARGTSVITAFRTTIGLPGRLGTRLQPNHPTDDPRGIAAATLDGLLLGCGDAVIGINPATDSPAATADLLYLLDEIRQRFDIPTQSCVLSHVTTTIELIESGVPVDLVFQSIAGTQGANAAFGVDISLLREANEAGRSLHRGTVGNNVMYLETGQGSALSAGEHFGTGGKPVDQQTLETRAYAVARDLEPLLVNTVVGFIGPEYLYDGKQIIRAGLEDNFCGRLLGAADGRRCLLHQPCRGRPGRHGHPADAARRGRRRVRDRRARAPTTSCWATRACRSTTCSTSGRCWACGRRRSSRTGCRASGWPTAPAGCCRSTR